jgi:hypothetical protein
MSNINGAINVNERLRNYLEHGTQELRTFLASNVVSNSNHELNRIEQYYLYWKFYEGKHYRDFNHTMLSFNYVRAFIDKIISFLMGTNGVSFNVESLYNENVPDDKKVPLEELILFQWRKNNLSLTIHEILQMGSICGDVWVMPTWDAENRYVKINVLDSRQSFPIFENGDFNKLVGFQVRQVLQNDYNIIKRTGKHDYRMFVTYYTKDTIETWFQTGAEILRPKVNFYEKNKFDNDVHEYKKTVNPLGFIPIVHIKNKPNSASYFGRSDAQDILKLNKVYNELTQELKGIIDYYATPTTVVTGATIKNMKRGLGNIWSGLPPEANVFTLGLDADLSSMTAFLDKLKMGMHELSDVPENVLGKLQAISGTSAAALQLTYQPLVQQADIKSLTYGEGIAEINEMILRILFKFDKNNKRLSGFKLDDFMDSGDYRIYPKFSYGFPSDRMSILQEAQVEQQLGITHREAIMKRLGINNIPDALNKIRAEKVQDMIIQSMLGDLISNQEESEEGEEQIEKEID